MWLYFEGELWNFSHYVKIFVLEKRLMLVGITEEHDTFIPYDDTELAEVALEYLKQKLISIKYEQC
jgi:hypothetical protein